MIDNGFLEPVSESSEWWSDHTVFDLGISQPVTLSLSTTIAEAIETLKSKGFDQVPVLGADGVCKGTVTIGNLTSLLVSGRVKCEETVDKALYKQFKKVTLTSKLSHVSQLLNNHHYLFVVDAQDLEKIVGVVSGIDLLGYISAGPK